MNNKKMGIILIILSSLFFSLMAMTVKSVNMFPLIQKVFFRNLVGVIVLAYFVLKDKKLLRVNNKKLLLGRCAFGLIGVFMYYWSITLLPLSEAVVINKLSPFFVIILGSLFLKEKIKASQIWAVLIALTGIIILLKPQMAITLIPAMIGVLGSFSAGAAYVIIRQLRLSEQPLTIVFYFCLTSSIVTLPFLIPIFVMPDLLNLIQLIFIGVFALIAQLLMTNAYRHAPASQLSIYTYANIVFSSIFGVLFWQEKLTDTFLIGTGLIIFAGFFNYYFTSKKVV